MSANLNAGGGNRLVASLAGSVGIWEEFEWASQCLTATCFDNPDFTDASYTRRERQVDWNWRNSSPIPKVMAPDTFSARWTGYIIPRYSQPYTFYVKAHDGVRLWVNNQQLINKWANVPVATEYRTVTVNLQAGVKYPIKLEYYQSTGAASCKLMWSSQNQAKQVIPEECTLPQ